MDGTRHNYRGVLRWATTSLLLTLLSAPSPSAGEPRSSTALEIPARLALRTAVKKLSRPGCHLVYADFRDARGVGLDEALASRGESGAAHLAGLTFTAAAARSAACERGGVLAFTSIGSSTVFLCAPAFANAARADVGVASATLIHEQLHTLGLGEGPPTSREITEQVLRRCGR